MKITHLLACMAMAIVHAACSSGEQEKLPILGEKEYITTVREGVEHIDTVFHTVPQFRFLDQDSSWVTNETFEGKIYLADFFFTRCPTICPIMSKNLLAIARHFEGNERFAILSHTIDPKHDLPPVLKSYADKLGAPPLWHFVNGPKEEVYRLAGQEGYFSFAQEDADAPGGFNHSGAFTLVDEERRVRGVYDGTLTDSIPKVIADIEKLLDKG
ncbi:SCO family protein [Parapedobacter indicus]|uniref:Protein SCO1/2 n=1 Tax=Parapedobacter indicus TaxID=1477437 RepID=A0A1I3NNB1_9SPHI|nr:SCO family protein [Parapedobacter indicus]PPL01035.1 protein SCO1/2 [Parapedobacter indicus]SFJ10649.1 protein SCO1/2 [Parapedobacter indicus]